MLIAELMPKILNTQLYKAVLDSNASEHGARMTAMDKASENANEMLRTLKISYNRARQAAITTELTEIVSGAAALQGIKSLFIETGTLVDMFFSFVSFFNRNVNKCVFIFMLVICNFVALVLLLSS